MRVPSFLACLSGVALLGVTTHGGAIPGPYCLPVKKDLRSRAVSFSVNTLDGSTLQFSNSSGKPAVIGFFATWCGPCNREMPAFVAIAHRYEAQGFQPVLIDLHEKPAVVESFVKRFGVDFPIGIDDGSVFQTMLGLHAIPSSAFYNAQGVLTCLVQDGLTEKEIDNEASAAVGGWMPR